MNPNASLRAWLEVIDSATEWELFDARQLPPVPRWVQVVSAAALVLLATAGLVGALWGGPS